MTAKCKVACVAWPALWLGLLAAAAPIATRLTPYDQDPVIVWAWAALLQWRGVIALVQTLGTLALMGWVWRRTREEEAIERLRVLECLPLLACAWLFPLWLYRHALDPRVVANVLFYVPVLACVWPVAARLHRWGEGEQAGGFGVRHVIRVTLAASAFFWCTGMAYTHWCGEHAGDEGHYLIQIASLYLDGDLDIRNQYEDLLGDELDVYLEHGLLGHRLHVSPASRNDRWYSYHTPGLSFLTYWTYPFGMWARHLVLALIAGLAVGGVYVMCRLAGAGHRASVIVLGLYMTSLYATVYASRFLPEQLGVTLTSWLMVSVMIQRARPVAAVALGAAMVAALPWAHLRFLPLALLGFGFFGLYGLCLREPWKGKLVRLTAFTLLAGGGLLFYTYWQHQFFEGGYSHPVGSLFMNYPLGVLYIFTRHPRFADVLPLVVWLVPVGFLGWRLAGRQWPLLAMSCALFLATWIVTCSGGNYGGGATLAGRFLVAVTPLLLPAAACHWMQTTRSVRTWIVFLSLLSVALSVIQFVYLPELGRAFARPFDTVPIVARGLWGWHTPWPGAWVLYAAVAVHAVFVFVPRLPRGAVRGLLAGLLIMNVIGQSRTPGLPSSAPTHWPGTVARQLAHYRLSGIGLETPGGAPAQPIPLLDVANQLVSRHGVPFETLRITTTPLEEAHVDDVISQPLLGDNDWAGRGWGWATLWPPLNVGRGERVLALAGRVQGDAQPVLALREGAELVLEKPLPVDADGVFKVVERFNMRSRRSLLYILIHLRGEGEVVVESLRLAPVSDRLLADGALTLE